jgi:hypothetical protein
LIEIADVLSSGDLGNFDRQTVLLYCAADLALTSPQLAVEDELHLLEHLETEFVARGSHAFTAWQEKSRDRARRWLNALHRLDEAIGPDFDPDDVPVLGVAPPRGLPSGVAPDGIDDPIVRRRYEAELEENQQKARRFAQRYRARQLRDEYEPRAVRYLANVFGASGADRAELTQLLDEYEVDIRRRTVILATARARGRGMPS